MSSGDIPRIYSMAAQFLSCLSCSAVFRQRFPSPARYFLWLASGVALCASQLLMLYIPIAHWVFFLYVPVLVMLGTLLLLFDEGMTDILFFWAFGFILSEFAASAAWQAYSSAATNSRKLAVLSLFLVYSATYVTVFWLLRRSTQRDRHIKFSWRISLMSLIVAFGTYYIGNISYLTQNSALSVPIGSNFFYVRTLVDFTGVTLLFQLYHSWLEMRTKEELSAINAALWKQQELYSQTHESVEAMNQKYHDLKHQLQLIRAESNSGRREQYLQELEEGIKHYEAGQNTGNAVLDTILTSKQLLCMQKDISMTVVADGTRLSFMDAMDICSVFGNALENAMESVLQISDKEKRLIRVAVYTEADFLLIRFENYYENEISRNHGQFLTTKKDAQHHGYGIKSIRYIAEKYRGNVSITTEDHWFRLLILFPLQDMPT